MLCSTCMSQPTRHLDSSELRAGAAYGRGVCQRSTPCRCCPAEGPLGQCLSQWHGLLLVQMKALEPSTRVLVLGTSSEPQMCVKKDEKAFLSFFDKHIYMPLPDYASRLVSWPLCWRVQPSLCSPLQHPSLELADQLVNSPDAARQPCSCLYDLHLPAGYL